MKYKITLPVEDGLVKSAQLESASITATTDEAGGVVLTGNADDTRCEMTLETRQVFVSGGIRRVLADLLDIFADGIEPPTLAGQFMSHVEDSVRRDPGLLEKSTI